MTTHDVQDPTGACAATSQDGAVHTTGRVALKSIRGRRRITDAEVERIMTWWRNHRTINDWARTFGVTPTTILAAIKDWISAEQWNQKWHGRRRALSVAQVEMLLVWYRGPRTHQELADEMGLTKSMVTNVICQRGYYKTCSPEQREVMRAAWRARRESLEGPRLPRWTRRVQGTSSRRRPDSGGQVRSVPNSFRA